MRYSKGLTHTVFARLAFLLSAASLAAAQPSVLLDAMSQELNRNFTALKEKADPPPYFLSYEVTETEYQSVIGTLGTIDVQQRRQEPRAGRLGPGRVAEARQLPPRSAAIAASSRPARC